MNNLPSFNPFDYRPWRKNVSLFKPIERSKSCVPLQENSIARYNIGYAKECIIPLLESRKVSMRFTNVIEMIASDVLDMMYYFTSNIGDMMQIVRDQHESDSYDFTGYYYDRNTKECIKANDDYNPLKPIERTKPVFTGIRDGVKGDFSTFFEPDCIVIEVYPKSLIKSFYKAKEMRKNDVISDIDTYLIAYIEGQLKHEFLHAIEYNTKFHSKKINSAKKNGALSFKDEMMSKSPNHPRKVFTNTLQDLIYLFSPSEMRARLNGVYQFVLKMDERDLDKALGIEYPVQKRKRMKPGTIERCMYDICEPASKCLTMKEKYVDLEARWKSGRLTNDILWFLRQNQVYHLFAKQEGIVKNDTRSISQMPKSDLLKYEEALGMLLNDTEKKLARYHYEVCKVIMQALIDRHYFEKGIYENLQLNAMNEDLLLFSALWLNDEM